MGIMRLYIWQVTIVFGFKSSAGCFLRTIVRKGHNDNASYKCSIINEFVKWELQTLQEQGDVILLVYKNYAEV
ncbi:hypothetical protein ADH76_34335 [Enterocloster clostridioformis]|nr:hypothetical protein A4V08_06340 [Lachnoclostridium sp. YL32]OXE61555.1 hypothetical protein ADH76_34335 [Enterocloster clostridioformis]